MTCTMCQVNVTGKINYKTAMEEVINKGQCFMSDLRENVGLTFEEERRLGRNLEGHFGQRISWEVIDIFLEKWIGKLSYYQNGSSRKKLESGGPKIVNHLGIYL